MTNLLRSLGYAGEGIAHVIRNKRNSRIHLAVGVMVAIAGICFRLAPIEWAVLALTIGAVISAEMLNTVAELAVDMLTQQYHPMAKVAKDVGAGAVLVSASAAVLTGIAIFGPRVWSLLFG